MRHSRKLDHIKYALQIDDGPVANSFADFKLIHHCLTDLVWDELNITSAVAGIAIANPIIVNAITGGADDVAGINARLAEFAKITGCTMAVGSQFAAIENNAVEPSYRIIRQVNPNGVVFANLGAYATPEQAQTAIDMVEASAIQIHLNPAQEIMMAEGDRDFSRYMRNIDQIIKKVDVPVIVKEVGFGIAREQARSLIGIGVSAIDIGGAGGTNFIAIEAARKNAQLESELLEWGIPAAISSVEVAQILPDNVDLIVSGGIRTPLEAVKALALQGKAVGLAAPILKIVQQQGVEQAVNWFTEFTEIMKKYMLLVGAKNIAALAAIPVVITGYSAQWLSSRGIDLKKYAGRSEA